ncbi:TPA: carbamoyl phosphate synthase small subunit, partial [Staphylococcus aureus]|nr:carbamoyl phosphate synthase small subunit [Staphylococcus aureus]
MQSKRYLVLEDGSFYEGYRLGSDNLTVGEIVFNTAMTGYQETIS